jgi:lipoate-protein ligase A
MFADESLFKLGIDVAEGLATEAELLNATSFDGMTRSFTWTSRPALVATAVDCPITERQTVRALLNPRGISLALRQSGGEAVVLGEGIVIATFVYAEPNDAPVNTANGFHHLYNIVEEALNPFGSIELGSVPGSYCDGRFNFTHHGHKLGGTAQQQKKRNYRAVLTHAAIMVDCNIMEHMNLIEEFYNICGKPRRYHPALCVNVSEMLASDHADLTAFVASRIDRVYAKQDVAVCP